MANPRRGSGGLLKILTITAFAAGLAYLFFGEHRVHLLGWLPFLFLLACPLLHLTMHSGHGRHGGQSDTPDEPPSHHHTP